MSEVLASPAAAATAGVVGGDDVELFEIVPCPSVVVWRAPGPASAGAGPGEWLHCAGCGASAWFPHGGHGQALLLEALDEHLGHRGGGRRG